MTFYPDFDPAHLDLNTANPREVYCYLQLKDNDYSGGLGVRVSALFVIGIVSALGTVFPVLAARVSWLRIPTYVYLFARYFGTGVIVCTAYIHLLSPAFKRIGAHTCVGETGDWTIYDWTPAIVLASTMVVWLIDFGSCEYVQRKYGVSGQEKNVENLITSGDRATEKAHAGANGQRCHANGTHGDIDNKGSSAESSKELGDTTEFKMQFSAFLIMEMGIILHSIFIGLNFGVVGKEWVILYPVLVFHQAFEGLGIGARMSAIPFPRHLKNWLPWVLCAAYGLTTPIAIAAGLGVRHIFSTNSLASLTVIGVCNAISAGVLIYTGLVELLARDFIFDPAKTTDGRRLTFMTLCVFLGAGVMAVIGKWA